MSTANNAPKKKKILGGHKAHVQKLSTAIDKILGAFDMKNEAELLGLRDTLTRKAVILAQLDDEILQETEDDDIDDAIEANEAIQEKIQQKIREIDVLLRRAHKAEEDAKAAAKPETKTVKMRPKATVKLPKYEIKKFSGEPTVYRAFWDAFKVAIDDNDQLSKVEKFTYLQGYVTGDAVYSIGGLTATDANYVEALAILKQRYGNKQVIVNSHMKALTSLSSVQDDKDTKKRQSPVNANKEMFCSRINGNSGSKSKPTLFE